MVLRKKGGLIVFTIFTLLIITLAAFFLYDIYHDYISSRSARLKNNSYLLSEWISDYFISSEYILRNITNQVSYDQIIYPPPDKEIYTENTQIIDRIVSTLPNAVYYGIVDESGILSHSNSVDGFDFSNRDFFKTLKESPELDSIVTNAFKSPEGYYFILHAHKYKSADSHFKGLALAGVELGFFDEWMKEIEDSDSGTISVVDENGLLLSSSLEIANCDGCDYKELNIDDFKSLNTDYGLFRKGEIGISGKKIHAVRKVSDLPFYIVIAEENLIVNTLGFPSFMVILSLFVSIFLGASILKDHLNQIHMTSELEQTSSELKIIFDNSMVGIIYLDNDRRIVRANKRFAEMSGCGTTENAEGRKISDFYVNDEAQRNFTEIYITDLSETGTASLEFEFKRLDGSRIWVSLFGKTIDNSIPIDPSKGIIWIVDDITDQYNAKKKLMEMATRDPLTDLFNRRHFIELGNREFALFDRNKGNISILMIDLDHFKSINDKYGHGTGDKALIHFTGILTSSLRGGDIPSRIGGEEFAVILPNTDSQKAVIVAERIREKCELSSISAGRFTIKFTISIGIAEAAPGLTLFAVLQLADKALYDAKNSGRNKVCMYSADKKTE